MKSMIKKILSAIILTLLGTVAFNSFACSVPVFRFALERWRNAPYEIFILHKGALTEAEKKIYGLMENAQYERGGFSLFDIDIEKTDERSAKIWEKHKNDNLPAIVVRYPEWTGAENDAWAGPFTKENAGLVLDSPIRRKIAELIVKGESAVWLFIESSDKQKNDAALSLIEKELKTLAEKLPLSDMKENETTTDIQSSSPVQITKSFKTITVSRKDPAEKGFLEMLYSSDNKIKEDAPVVIPIFGRGRALYPLIGDKINDEQIAGVCSFILGPCSCQVKELNPGIDLLICFDWEKNIFYTIQNFEVPPITGFEGFLPAAEVKETKPQAVPEKSIGKPAKKIALEKNVEKEVKSENLMLRNLSLLFAGLAVIIIVFTLAAIKKKKIGSNVENAKEDKP